MNIPKMTRGRFLAAAAGGAGLAFQQHAIAGRFAQRYRFSCEMNSAFAFLVDPPVVPLNPNPSIAESVRSGKLKQRERVEFPYGGGDILRSLAYYEDPAKPFSESNVVPQGDPRILIEIYTDITSILVKKEPFLHFTAMGLVVGNPTGTIFGDLNSRVMIFSAAVDPSKPSSLRLAVSSTASSHVLGAASATGSLQITEGGLL